MLLTTSRLEEERGNKELREIKSSKREVNKYSTVIECILVFGYKLLHILGSILGAFKVYHRQNHLNSFFTEFMLFSRGVC